MKISPLKRKVIFQTSIFGFHVSFRGCTEFPSFTSVFIEIVPDPLSAQLPFFSPPESSQFWKKILEKNYDVGMIGPLALRHPPQITRPTTPTTNPWFHPNLSLGDVFFPRVHRLANHCDHAAGEASARLHENGSSGISGDLVLVHLECYYSIYDILQPAPMPYNLPQPLALPEKRLKSPRTEFAHWAWFALKKVIDIFTATFRTPIVRWNIIS